MTLASFINLRPVGGFGLIMADPAWRYDMRSEKGYGKAPEAHYQTMPTEEIAAMPVEVLAAPDCLLWLWAVNPKLPDALAVMAAWGFTFKTAGTWVKRTTRGKDAFGTGYVLRSSNEPFLLGTRGAPRTTKATRSTIPTYDDGFHSLAEGGDWPAGSITIEGKLREHSRKPDAAYQAAEGLMPEARRLELFSRQARSGWTVWGNETAKFEVAV